MADAIVEKGSTVVSFVTSGALVVADAWNFMDEHTGAFGVLFGAVALWASLHFQKRRDKREVDAAQKIRGR